MSNPVIQCEGLGKSYLIGHQGARERYTTLRDVISRQMRGVWQATRRALRGQTAVDGDEIEEFWALRDVSFEVNTGEVVGIIGRNGAGKSTLLKILSRITEPTEGRVTLRGRVASLLEVGTGFHPELTGRENIFLNGAVLGMTRAEINRKFDEIVAFAEVEKFLDTPVKRFSSGMYVRLAFAVAAHLEPEILLVDEVLAVGDADFQKKCLGKMHDVSRGGRTVLFVSHNMQAIRNLCKQVVLLRGGLVQFIGATEDGIERYVGEGGDTLRSIWKRNGKLPPASPLTIMELKASLSGNQPRHRLTIDALMHATGPHKPALLAIDIFDAQGSWIMQAIPSMEPLLAFEGPWMRCQVEVVLPPLIPGYYHVGAWVGPDLHSTYDDCREAVSFEIQDSPSVGRNCPHNRARGYIVPESSILDVTHTSSPASK